MRRHRLGITAALVCHVVLASSVVTSQLLPTARPDSGSAIPPPQGSSATPAEVRPGEEVTIKAREQEKSGDIYKLRGEVEIDFRNLVLQGDEVSYDASTGEVTASGHLTLDGGFHDEHIAASHGQYNVRTQTGRFYDVVGTSGVRFRGRNVSLTSTNPFTFTGKMVEKIGPEVYVVHYGSATSCELPRPKWTLNADRIVVDLGGKARAYGSTFRIEKVPLLYLPYADHPVEQLGRQSGFLLPSIGTSSRKGLILGESYYWAVNRSMDTTIGAEYFSSRGWAQHGTWRFRPSEDSYINARYFGVLDRGFGPAHIDQGGEDVKLDGEARFSRGFRGVLSADYVSSFLFRLAFGETFAQTVDSEVKSAAFVSKNLDGFGFNFLAARYQNFQSTTPGDVVTILRVPSFAISSVERPLGRTRLFWSFDTALEAVSRKEPGFLTNDLVGRFDVHPDAALPLLLRGWTMRPEIGLRETYYTQRQEPNPTGGLPAPVEQDINRNAAEASFELRPPPLSRIFGPIMGRKLKHSIEPRLVYRYVAGVDSFADIIRFDSRDILSNTNELEYAVIHRIYIKRASEPDCRQQTPGSESATGGTAPLRRSGNSCRAVGAREFLSWELKQKYFFDPDFGGAVVPGIHTRYVFTTTDQFSGIAFLTSPRRFTPIVSRILVHPSNQTEFGWQLDYDTVGGGVNASTIFSNYRLGNFFLGGTHTYFRDFFTNPIPGPDRFNQFRVTLGYGNLSKRGVNGAANIGFDANLNFLEYAAFQTSYNWDCCGLNFEYRRYALGSVRNENQFRFAFTLANIATFGNLKRQERLY
jgi:LPS-assembly protein